MAEWTSSKDKNGFQLRLNMVTVGSPDIPNNRSQVRIRGWIVSTYASSIATGTGNGVLNGGTVATLNSASRTVPLNGTLQLFDQTRWVTHGSDGNKTVSGSVTYGTSNQTAIPWSITRRTQSGSLKLPKITQPKPPDPEPGPDPDPPKPKPTDAYIQLYADAYVVSQDGNRIYFDGATPGAYWTGTANASTSARPNPNDVPFYDAYADNNRIMSAESGKPETHIIDTGYYAKQIFNPIPTDLKPNPAGTYYVSDSTQLPIVSSQWTSYGGSVILDINDLGQLEVTITPPSADIPGTTGPYYLAYADGESRYAALKVNGIGVVSDPVTLNIPTGADWTRVNNELALSVDLPWITNRREAYTAANRLAFKAAGAAPSLSFTVSFNEIEALGLTAGSVIDFKDARYRVVSLSMSRGGANVRLDPWTTVGEFDELWEGTTIGEFDDFWSGKKIRDMNQKPLLKE